MNGLFLHCRPGFESECAAEIQAGAAELGISGYCKAKPAAAYVVFVTGSDDEAIQLHQELPFAQLIFTRQWFRLLALAKDLRIDDRISGLLEACAGIAVANEVFLETTDTNEGKELQALCRSLARPLQSALAGAKLLSDDAHAPRLHVCFMATTAAYIGVADRSNSSPYLMGIPRLRFPSSAPSRSTLKLEEAFLTFLDADERDRMLRPGMHAVDLGAAPGGWSWQLVQARPARHRRRQWRHGACLTGQRIAGASSRRWFSLSSRRAGRLDGLRHRRTTRPHRRARRALVERRRLPLHGIQSEAADEETLSGSHAVSGRGTRTSRGHRPTVSARLQAVVSRP